MFPIFIQGSSMTSKLKSMCRRRSFTAVCEWITCSASTFALDLLNRPKKYDIFGKKVLESIPRFEWIFDRFSIDSLFLLDFPWGKVAPNHRLSLQVAMSCCRWSMDPKCAAHCAMWSRCWHTAQWNLEKNGGNKHWITISKEMILNTGFTYYIYIYTYENIWVILCYIYSNSFN